MSGEKKKHLRVTARLNVGPGRRWRRAGWRTLDHYVTTADYRVDLRESPRLPLPSYSLEKIFCSHVSEQLGRLDVGAFGRWCVSLIPGDASYRAHINAFWPERVVALLREAGFREVEVSAFRASRDPELREADFDNRPGISLFVEARATPGLYGRLASQLWRAVHRVVALLRRR